MADQPPRTPASPAPPVSPPAVDAGLSRELNLFDASTIVMGSMIGSGIFITSAESLRLVGSPGWLLMAWVVSGLLTVAGAICVAEVAAMLPRAGGQYVFFREAYGASVGFVFGWSMLLVVQTGTIAAVAVAFAKYLGVLAPWVASDHFLVAPISIGSTGFAICLSTQQLVAVILIATLSYLNTRGLRAAKLVQNLFTSTKVLALLGLIAAGLFLGFRKESAAMTSAWWDSARNGWSMKSAAPSLESLGLLGFLMVFGKAMIGPLFSQTSWNSVTFTGGEIKEPGRVLPRALIIGTTTVIGLYLMANLAYLVALPYDQIAHADQDRVGTALMKAIVGPAGVVAMALAILVSTFGCINGLVLSGSRLIYAMAVDGLFFASTGRLNRRHVPATAIAIQGAWAILLVLPVTVKLAEGTGAPVYGNTYNQLLEFLAPVDLSFYLLMVATIVVFRRTRPDQPRPYRSWGYPLPFLFYSAIASALVLDFLYLEPKTAGIGFLIALAGFPAYGLARLVRRRPAATGS